MATQAQNPISPLSRQGIALLLSTLCIVLMFTETRLVEAAIFTCPSGDSIIYQDRPCPRKQPVKTVSKQTTHFPLSIHESWFDLPEQAEERAFCDRRSCECGRQEKMHDGSLAQAVADALYVDGSWHRYETTYEAWLATPASSQQQSFGLREQMLEASCDIMMAQVILRQYADDVVKTLKKRKRTAEERGFDVEQPCLQDIPDACSYFDSVQLLSRVQQDAASLRRTRGENALLAAQPVERDD